MRRKCLKTVIDSVGVRQRQVIFLLKTVCVFFQEPEIPQTSGCIGCGFCDCILHRILAPGMLQVKNCKNNGALVETSLLMGNPGSEEGEVKTWGHVQTWTWFTSWFNGANGHPRNQKSQKFQGTLVVATVIAPCTVAYPKGHFR